MQPLPFPRQQLVEPGLRQVVDARQPISQPIAAALKTVYDAVDDKAAEAALTAFEDGPWGEKYAAIGKAWRRA